MSTVERLRHIVEASATYSLYLRVNMCYVSNGASRWYTGWVSRVGEVAMDISFLNGEIEQDVSLRAPQAGRGVKGVFDPLGSLARPP